MRRERPKFMKAGVCHARGVMSIPSARLNLKFPALARPARPDACAFSSTRCQHASNIAHSFKNKQQTLPSLHTSWRAKTTGLVNLRQGAQAGSMPHANACHHLPFRLYTEAAAAKVQQGGAQGHARQEQRHAAPQLGAFSHGVSPE